METPSIISTRSKYPPPMAKYKGINADLKKIPQTKSRSSNRWYRNREKRKALYVLCGSLACVILIGAAFGIPIALTTILTTSSAATEPSTATPTNTSVTAAVSTSVSAGTISVSSITASTSTLAATTSLCPNMTCTFSAVAAPMTSLYGAEQLLFNCSQTLAGMNIEITVQRTVNATYANQYQTFWNLTTHQTYVETSSEIIYRWMLITGQYVQGIGFPYFVEAQYSLLGINQTTSLDTYSATFTSICGDIISQNGTF